MIELLLFILMTLVLGNSFCRIAGREFNTIDDVLICIPVGLAATVVLTMAYGFLHILSPFAFLGSLVGMLIFQYLRCGGFDYKVKNIKLDTRWVIALMIVIIYTNTFITGAFSYPWLEDDDSWQHAAGVRFISEFETFMQPEPRLIHYLAPYPPAYDSLMSLLHQIGDATIPDILKAYNAGLCGLTLLFFYIWVRNKYDKDVAIWALLLLAVVPAFMSHFIWSQTLALFFLFPVLYFLDRWNADGKLADCVLGVLVMAALLVSQPSVAGVAFAMTLIYQGSVLLKGRFKEGLAIHAGGLLFALLVLWVPLFMMFGVGQVAAHMTFTPEFVTGGSGLDTAGGKVYDIEELMSAPAESRMDQPTGFGPVIFVIALIGLGIVLVRTVATASSGAASIDLEYLVLLGLLVFGIVGLEANLLPVKMMPHRFWVFLAVPVVIISALAITAVHSFIRHNVFGKLATILFVVVLLATTAVPKYVVETSQWPPGVKFVSNEQLVGYMGLKQLPADTKVFSFCGHEDLVNGVGMYGYSWAKEVKDYKNRSIGDTLQGNVDFIHKYNYTYVVIDQNCLLYASPEDIKDRISVMVYDSRTFIPDEQYIRPGFIVFKVVG